MTAVTTRSPWGQAGDRRDAEVGQFWAPKRRQASAGAQSIQILDVFAGEVLVQKHDAQGDPLGKPRKIKKSTLRSEYSFVGTNVERPAAP